MRRPSLFLIALLTIALVGMSLRFWQYDRLPPYNETADEFYYPFAGLSFVTTGVPTSWTQLPAYASSLSQVYWGIPFGLVTPWLEKPFLYPLLSAGVLLLQQIDTLPEIRVSALRLLPISLSFLTIIFVGLVGKFLLRPAGALVAAAIYATVPTIVFGNRLSLVENLLTPILLASLYLLVSNWRSRGAIGGLALLCGLAVATKNTGIAVPLAVLLVLLQERRYLAVVLVAITTANFGLLQALMGAYYDWSLFASVLNAFHKIHSEGLPQLVATLFRYPIVAERYRAFLDGTILWGYLVFFTLPWRFSYGRRELSAKAWSITWGFGLVYLAVVSLLTVGTPTTTVGWYFYPLYPFLAIAVAHTFQLTWRHPHALQMLVLWIIVGVSTIRFVLVLAPRLQPYWQMLLLCLAATLVGSCLLPRRYQQFILATSFIGYLAVNVLVVTYGPLFYPTASQP